MSVIHHIRKIVVKSNYRKRKFSLVQEKLHLNVVFTKPSTYALQISAHFTFSHFDERARVCTHNYSRIRTHAARERAHTLVPPQSDKHRVPLIGGIIKESAFIHRLGIKQ